MFPQGTWSLRIHWLYVSFWSSNVPKEKSSIVDLLMIDIKKSSKDKTIHAKSIWKVNASFVKFVVDFIAMLLLFDVFTYHNAQAAPTQWAGMHLSIKE